MKVKSKSHSKVKKASAAADGKEKPDEAEEIAQLQQRLREETPESGSQIARCVLLTQIIITHS
jgi:hypothetical protein